MKNLFLLLFVLVSAASYGQLPLPKGAPYPFSTGWSKSGYYQSDSASIMALRDTNWTARFVGSLVFYISSTDTALYIWNGKRWMGVAGTATPINPNDFIRNQYAAKETKRAWFDTVKVVNAYMDTFKVRNSINRDFRIYWADTTTLNIEFTRNVAPGKKMLINTSGDELRMKGTQVYVDATNGLYANQLYSPVGLFGDAVSFDATGFYGITRSAPLYPPAPGNNVLFKGGGGTIGTSDQNGGTAIISGGNSTGTGVSQVDFKTASGGSSGTTVSTPTTKMSVLGNGGVLFTPMTSTQRDAIASPAEGTLIYNSTTHTFNYWNGSAWTAL